jgi:hypothetical protein
LIQSRTKAENPHNEELRDMHSSKAGGKVITRKTKKKVGDNIKTDRVEIEWDGVDWIGLAQDRDTWRALVKAAMNLRVP